MFFPLRATTKSADSMRDCASNHKKLEGVGHPATPSGPPLTNTLQAPRRHSPQEWNRLESPVDWPSPLKATSHILSIVAIVRPRTADGQ